MARRTRRIFSAEQKAEILALAERKGVANAAAQYKVTEGRIYTWRTIQRSAAKAEGPRVDPALVPSPPTTDQHVVQLAGAVANALNGKTRSVEELRNELLAERYIALGRADAYAHVLRLLEAP
jgi:transposase-like protein